MSDELRNKYPGIFEELEEYISIYYRPVVMRVAELCGAGPIEEEPKMGMTRMEKTCDSSECYSMDIDLDFPGLLLGKKTFLEQLMQYIIESEMTNAEIYGKAHMSRQAFSKIISGDVIPKKSTILSLAIALNLSLDDTEDLLKKAGHALVETDLGDVIVSYFIENEKYDIELINEYLHEYDQNLLGNVVA